MSFKGGTVKIQKGYNMLPRIAAKLATVSASLSDGGSGWSEYTSNERREFNDYLKLEKKAGTLNFTTGMIAILSHFVTLEKRSVMNSLTREMISAWRENKHFEVEVYQLLAQYANTSTVEDVTNKSMIDTIRWMLRDIYVNKSQVRYLAGLKKPAGETVELGSLSRTLKGVSEWQELVLRLSPESTLANSSFSYADMVETDKLTFEQFLHYEQSLRAEGDLTPGHSKSTAARNIYRNVQSRPEAFRGDIRWIQYALRHSSMSFLGNQYEVGRDSSTLEQHFNADEMLHAYYQACHSKMVRPSRNRGRIDLSHREAKMLSNFFMTVLPKSGASDSVKVDVICQFARQLPELLTGPFKSDFESFLKSHSYVPLRVMIAEELSCDESELEGVSSSYLLEIFKSVKPQALNL